jgi:hypothetical protein
MEKLSGFSIVSADSVPACSSPPGGSLERIKSQTNPLEMLERGLSTPAGTTAAGFSVEPSSLCSLCAGTQDRLEAIVRCSICDDLLCEDHSNIHRKSARTSDHRLLPLARSGTPDACLSLLRSRLQRHQIIPKSAVVLGDRLGAGSFGVAYRATLNGTDVCLKVPVGDTPVHTNLKRSPVVFCDTSWSM